MGKRKAAEKKAKVEDYRHEEATRKNNPPAKIAAEGHVPVVAKARYAYSPRRSPELRFDQDAEVEKLIEKATRQALTAEEAERLRQALSQHEPWLEWAAKREADQRGTFDVDPVALHIHERVSAQAILKAAARQDIQRSLFADLEQEYHEAVQFYRHDVDWSNRLILGDSLQVMSSLARREDLAGKVQMIYMDPPYGIKFASNFQPEISRRDVTDKEQDLTREPEMVKAYRDTWHLGIHSYLSYLRDRLIAARELLADTGSIFVQISDENTHLLRSLLDDVFGRDQFVRELVVKKTTSASGDLLSSVCDFVLWYCKDIHAIGFRQIFFRKVPGEVGATQYKWAEMSDGLRIELSDIDAISSADNSRVFVHDNLTSQRPSQGADVREYFFNGERFTPGKGTFKTDLNGLDRLAQSSRLMAIGSTLRFVRYLEDFPVYPISNVWDDTVTSGFADRKQYVVQTNPLMVERCLLMTTAPGDLVLDPTCGSGTTASVAEHWGRRWITIDTSRIALAIARQRLLTAKFDRYRVQGEDENGNGSHDDRPGVSPSPNFVYTTVPHITLGSIAQNENLDPIFARHEPILDEKLAACNAALADVTDAVRAKLQSKLVKKERDEGKRSVTDADRRRWELPKVRGQGTGDRKQDAGFAHWTVPFDTDPDWPKALQKAVTEYRSAWRAKMDAVNACIAANAQPETLVDKPEVIKGIVRVSGPFTVEAVQPPEMSLGDVVIEGEREGLFAGEPEELAGTFEIRTVQPRPELDAQNLDAYLEQMTRLLRMDGVRFPNNKQMTFSRLERINSPSGFHAEGRWTPPGEEDADPEGVATVGVVFGPQYGPVTAKMVEELIRPASRRYDDLVIAGFNFDGAAQAVIEEVSHPKLRIHMAHIRPDVNPGMNGLLKEQPGSQLFTVFGQPRIAVAGPDERGEYRVTMEGVDIYNPVDNSIHSTGASKVAAWFLDGDYDGRTFCITQAFFPDKSAWEKLQRALKGVIDEEQFESLSGTESLPFKSGEHRRVAVKVIDPRGNEVMAVQSLG